MWFNTSETPIPDSIFIREIPGKSDLKVGGSERSGFERILYVAVVRLNENLLFDVVSRFNAEIEIPIGNMSQLSIRCFSLVGER